MSGQPLSAADKQLLDRLQRSFPLVERPFAALAEQAGLSEAEVIQKVGTWQVSGLVRRLGPVFDSKSIGYQSLLVAAACPEADLEQVVKTINSYEGVTHNYLREATDGFKLRYNLWFTMTAATQAEVEANLAEIQAVTGITDLLPLPAHRLYKIKVQFDLEGAESGLRDAFDQTLDQRAPGPVALTAEDWQLIEAFQTELAAESNPFAPFAAKLNVTTDTLLRRLQELLDSGVIRRFGATLKHYAVGLNSNAMGVWAVPPEREDEVGRIMATFKAVSHCYARPTYDEWPYNLYTMIHASSRQECAQIAAEIAKATQISDYHLLYTVKELKKKRMVYRAPRRNS